MSPFLLHTVSFTADVEIDPVDGIGTAALAATLVPAMRMGLPLAIEAPVSPLLLENLDEYQDIFACWFEPLQKITITAPVADRETIRLPEGRRSGSWFSLGVDGFDTYLRNADRIDDLIFIHGYDIDVEKHAHRNAVQAALESVANDLDKPLITMQTNIRSFSDDYVWWGHALGSVMGAAAHLLAGRLREVYWASSTDYTNLVPFGTSPLPDPYLSSDAMRVVNDGSGFTRLQKIAAIAENEIAMNHLRVCWGQDGSTQNCGVCEKCLRTMTALQFLGKLESAPTFGNEIDTELIRQQPISGAHGIFMGEFRKIATEIGAIDSPLMRAWEHAGVSSGVPGTELATAVSDTSFLKDLSGADRDKLFNELHKHAPRALAVEAAKHTTRDWRAVFDHLWKHHRALLKEAIFRQPGSHP